VNALVTYAPAILRGLQVTIMVGVFSILGCMVVSLILGILRSSARRSTRVVAGIVVELLRGASALVYLFWLFYAFPLIPGMPQMTPMVAAVLVLSAVGGAYGAEIVRAGIESVPRGQTDACHAIGLNPFQIQTRVILPQALSQIIPGFGSLAVDIVKWTSIVSFVGVQDVFYVANTVRTITYDSLTVFGFLALVYLLLCLVTAAFFRGIEYLLPLNRADRIRNSAMGPAVRAPEAAP